MKLLCKVVLILAQAENPDSVRKLIILGNFYLFFGMLLKMLISFQDYLLSRDIEQRVKAKELIASDASSLLDGNKLS